MIIWYVEGLYTTAAAHTLTQPNPTHCRYVWYTHRSHTVCALWQRRAVRKTSRLLHARSTQKHVITPAASPIQSTLFDLIADRAGIASTHVRSGSRPGKEEFGHILKSALAGPPWLALVIVRTAKCATCLGRARVHASDELVRAVAQLKSKLQDVKCESKGCFTP